MPKSKETISDSESGSGSEKSEVKFLKLYYLPLVNIIPNGYDSMRVIISLLSRQQEEVKSKSKPKKQPKKKASSESEDSGVRSCGN